MIPFIVYLRAHYLRMIGPQTLGRGDPANTFRGQAHSGLCIQIDITCIIEGPSLPSFCPSKTFSR